MPLPPARPRAPPPPRRAPARPPQRGSAYYDTGNSHSRNVHNINSSSNNTTTNTISDDANNSINVCSKKHTHRIITCNNNMLCE